MLNILKLTTTSVFLSFIFFISSVFANERVKNQNVTATPTVNLDKEIKKSISKITSVAGNQELLQDVKKSEVVEKNDMIIKIPFGMKLDDINFPLIVAKLSPTNANFPTITLTREYRQESILETKTNDLAKELEKTYEGLHYIVRSCKFLKNQTILPNVSSRLFQVIYSTGHVDFVSLVNILEYDYQTHYITTINILDDKNKLQNAISFQEKFIKYISFKTPVQKEKELKKKYPKLEESSKVTSTRNIVLLAIFLIAFIMMSQAKKK